MISREEEEDDVLSSRASVAEPAERLRYQYVPVKDTRVVVWLGSRSLRFLLNWFVDVAMLGSCTPPLLSLVVGAERSASPHAQRHVLLGHLTALLGDASPHAVASHAHTKETSSEFCT